MTTAERRRQVCGVRPQLGRSSLAYDGREHDRAPRSDRSELWTVVELRGTARLSRLATELPGSGEGQEAAVSIA